MRKGRGLLVVASTRGQPIEPGKNADVIGGVFSFAGRRHQALPKVVIRSAAWQAEEFGPGCAGLRKIPAKR
jgi:hypothetical protein